MRSTLIQKQFYGHEKRPLHVNLSTCSAINNPVCSEAAAEAEARH